MHDLNFKRHIREMITCIQLYYKIVIRKCYLDFKLCSKNVFKYKNKIHRFKYSNYCSNKTQQVN